MLVPLVIGLSYAFRDMQLINPFRAASSGSNIFASLYGDDTFTGALRNTLMVDRRLRRPAIRLRPRSWRFCSTSLFRPGIAQALVFLPWAVPTFLAGPELGLAVQSGDRPAAALAVWLSG